MLAFFPFLWALSSELFVKKHHMLCFFFLIWLAQDLCRRKHFSSHRIREVVTTLQRGLNWYKVIFLEGRSPEVYSLQSEVLPRSQLCWYFSVSYTLISIMLATRHTCLLLTSPKWPAKLVVLSQCSVYIDRWLQNWFLGGKLWMADWWSVGQDWLYQLLHVKVNKYFKS